jgi:hypothetical protein
MWSSRAISACDRLPAANSRAARRRRSCMAAKSRRGALDRVMPSSLLLYDRSCHYIMRDSVGQGHDLPKGSLVLGHVVMARRVRRGISPSVLAFCFDQIVTRQGVLAARLYVRALTNTIESSDASHPTPPSDMNLSNDRVLIGGDQVTPSERKVYSSVSEDEGLDVVGENLKDGIFERLRPAQTMSGDSLLRCGGTATEQSVAIYSGSACGLYGFDMTYLVQTGKRNHGTVEIGSKYFTIKLYATSTALLQVALGSDDSTL